MPERAGKYEYLVLVDDGTGPRSVTGDRPVYARYKAPVPRAVLLVHILVVFLSMMLAIRTGMQALLGGEVRPLLWATIGSLVLGAFVLGPIVQWYAFGVWWSGVPFGYDWTDNKVLVELLAWLGAAAVALSSKRPASRASRRPRRDGRDTDRVLHPAQHLRLGVRLHARLRARNRGLIGHWRRASTVSVEPAPARPAARVTGTDRIPSGAASSTDAAALARPPPAPSLAARPRSVS